MSKDAYGRIARRYDALFDAMNAPLRAIGLKMYPPDEAMRVLDVGCGTGSGLVKYQAAGCDVSGIDMSPSMLEVARLKLGEDANLHLGDASQMPYEDATFDLVTTMLTLHEMPPAMRDGVLTDMKRVLKPEGRLLIIDFHPGALRFPKGWLYKVVITFSEIFAGREHFKNYRQFMRAQGLPTLVAAQGLGVAAQKIVSGGNMALFLLTIGPDESA